MNDLNYSLKVLNAIFPDEQREAFEQQQADEAQVRYESGIVQEARDILDGQCVKAATVEHLRVLLDWLDGSTAGFVPEELVPEVDQDTPPF